MPVTSRLPALDWVKAAAIVAVTVAHAIPGFFDGTIRPAALVLIGLVGFHVPVFVIVAGFLSHANAPVGWRHVGERLGRLVPPYLVATAACWGLGVVAIPTLGTLVFMALTGSALGHYYFVPVLASCFLLLPILSRASNPQLLLLVASLAIVSAAMGLEPQWNLSANFFWQMREPLAQFNVGQFVLGIIASRYRDELRRGLTLHAVPSVLVAVVVIVAHTWLATMHHPLVTSAVVRTVYSVAVIALIAALAPTGPAPAPVRFLSEATLTIYLYHWIAYDFVMDPANRLSLPLRLIAMPAVGLAFGALVVVAGRRLLGRRSRVLIGA